MVVQTLVYCSHIFAASGQSMSLQGHVDPTACLSVQGESGAVSKAGVGRLANLGVTLQRRWANVLSDSTRQVGFRV